MTNDELEPELRINNTTRQPVTGNKNVHEHSNNANSNTEPRQPELRFNNTTRQPVTYLRKAPAGKPATKNVHEHSDNANSDTEMNVDFDMKFYRPMPFQ